MNFRALLTKNHYNGQHNNNHIITCILTSDIFQFYLTSQSIKVPKSDYRAQTLSTTFHSILFKTSLISKLVLFRMMECRLPCWAVLVLWLIWNLNQAH